MLISRIKNYYLQVIVVKSIFLYRDQDFYRFTISRGSLEEKILCTYLQTCIFFNWTEHDIPLMLCIIC